MPGEVERVGCLKGFWDLVGDQVLHQVWHQFGDQVFGGLVPEHLIEGLLFDFGVGVEAGIGGGDGGEGAAVERAGAVFGEGAAVLGGCVAFVGGESVDGVQEVELAHEGVAVDLGDDGGGGDGEGE